MQLIYTMSKVVYHCDNADAMMHKRRLTAFVSLSFSIFLILSHSYCIPSLFHTPPLTLSLSSSFTLSLTFSFFLTHCFLLTHWLSHSRSVPLSSSFLFSVSLSLSLTLSLPLALSYPRARLSALQTPSGLQRSWEVKKWSLCGSSSCSLRSSSWGRQSNAARALTETTEQEKNRTNKQITY